MARNVVAIVGSYRRQGTVELAVDAVLAGARAQGAHTGKIFLTEKHIEYCRNCRTCTQAAGVARGRCVIQDDMPGILEEVDAADAVVLGAPVNFYNVTAIFRTFLERLLGSAYWPWGKPWRCRAARSCRVRRCWSVRWPRRGSSSRSPPARPELCVRPPTAWVPTLLRKFISAWQPTRRSRAWQITCCARRIALEPLSSKSLRCLTPES